MFQDAGLSGTNVLKIDILDAAAQESIMIYQGSFALEQGAKYHIGFTAKADADRQIGVLLEQDGSWAYAWHEWIDLTPSPQSFSFEHIHGRSATEDVTFYFIVRHSLFPLLNADENIDVYIDNIYVVQEPPADPNLAHYPWPPDGAMHPDTWICCSWAPGQYASTHDVYFGENFDDVNDGTGETFMGNQSVLFWITGFPRFVYSPGLIPGTTYYWRIDEVNDLHPDSPWKGDVWSFWLPPHTAYDPVPADGAELIDPNTTLSWTAGIIAKSHTIYFGDDFEDVNNAAGGPLQQSTTYPPDALEFDKTYYWRVDEYDGYITYKGEIWSFSTKPAEPNIAHDPNPPNGAIHPDTWATLTWILGRFADSHNIYFGDNYEDVNEGTRNMFRGNQSSIFYIVGFPIYPDPTGFIPGTTYYWRIDEVNNLHTDSPWKGDVWSFTIAPETAYDPVPTDGAESVDPNVSLSWKAGLYAKSHTIYFGYNFNDVNGATGGFPQQSTTYNPGPLEFDKTYYWRVDEYDGHTTHKGEIWSFTTASDKVESD